MDRRGRGGLCLHVHVTRRPAPLARLGARPHLAGLVHGGAGHPGRGDGADARSGSTSAPRSTELEWTVNAYNLSFAVLLDDRPRCSATASGAGALYAAGLGAVRRGLGRLRPGAAASGCARSPRGPFRAPARRSADRSRLALLTAAFPPERRGAAIGLFSAVTGLAVASGPLVGGAVVEGWPGSGSSGSTSRSAWSRSPLVARAHARRAAAPTPARRPGPRAGRRGVLGLVWALVRGNARRLDQRRGARTCSRPGVRCWPGSRPGSCARREPMLPMRFFAPRASRPATRRSSSRSRSLFSAVFFYRAVPADRARLQPAGAGLRLMAWTGTFIVVAPVAGALADRIGERPLVAVGLTLQAVGMAWFALSPTPHVATACWWPVHRRRASGSRWPFPAAPELGRRRGRRPRRSARRRASTARCASSAGCSGSP